MQDVPDNHLSLTEETKLGGALRWLIDDMADAGEAEDDDGKLASVIKAEAALLTDNRDELFNALQGLLDDMETRGYTRSSAGEVFDSVSTAADELLAAGGKLSWYPAQPTPSP